MKKKIGILTYHASHNIGSMLQSYAMQTYVVEHFDCEVEFIDYSSPSQVDMYSIFPKIKNSKDLIKNIISIAYYKKFRRTFDSFENFKKIYLFISTKKFHYSKHIKASYDVVILGSDQIWNVNCLDYDDVYFADFIHQSKLVAYAPSFGGTNFLKAEIDPKKIKNLIEKIDYLSVREKNGKEWLEKITQKNINLVADPTLLLNKEKWYQLINHLPAPKYGEYLFFYGVPFSRETYSIVHAAAQKLGLKVVMLDARSWIYNFCYFKGFILDNDCSPLNYLNLIKHAKIVITTSFHGSIFSSVFQKDFWTITFKGTNPDDDRVNTLLTQMGMEDRLVFMEDLLGYDLLKSIDYSNYEKNLGPLVEASKKFLEDSIDAESI